jgi:PBP1b-binding outer membrane lipoprotein LpoB
MQRRSWVAVLLIALLLAGCAQGITGQAAAPNAPYSRENNEIRPEHGGGDGGGGGGGGGM